jgi:hypothetical protein
MMLGLRGVVWQRGVLFGPRRTSSTAKPTPTKINTTQQYSEHILQADVNAKAINAEAQGAPNFNQSLVSRILFWADGHAVPPQWQRTPRKNN